MSPDAQVRYDKDGRIAVVTLNRPEKRNAIDEAVDHRLREIWQDFSNDNTIDVAIWTGTGEASCAGAERESWFGPWLQRTVRTVRPGGTPLQNCIKRRAGMSLAAG